MLSELGKFAKFAPELPDTATYNTMTKGFHAADDSHAGVIRIDLWRLVQQRIGRYGRFLPHWPLRPLERIICQRQMNELLQKTEGLAGSAFCRKVLAELDIRLAVANADRLPASGRCVFVCNHPLGGLDGITLIAWLAAIYGREPKVLVNDLLTAVRPLAGNFVPVNKFGHLSRTSSICFDEALAGDDPVLVFPAGLVSRMDNKGYVSDLKWRKSFVTKALQSQRDVVPLYFDAMNSRRFYKVCRLRGMLGIKMNFEQCMLPSELFRQNGNTFRIVCGEPLPWATFKTENPDKEARKIREIVYALASSTGMAKPIQI